MRIISGKYKGRKLEGFDIDGTRPTSDRVKESLFAIIQNKIKDKRCLDLFAGSGSLGLEAISLGAKSCVFVDHNPKVLEVLKKNTNAIVIKEEITFEKMSYQEALQKFSKEHKKFDLVFLDPPYNMPVINDILTMLVQKDLLEKEAIVVCEFEEEQQEHPDYIVKTERKYGKRQIKILEFDKK